MQDQGHSEKSLLSGVTSLVGGQLAGKLITFSINQCVIRWISADALGGFAYFEFLYSSVLFFSREAIRLSCQQIKGKDARQRIVNLSYIPIAIGVPVALFLVWWQKMPLNVSSLFMASVIAELLYEPFFNLNQHEMNFSKRAKIESVALLLKCITQSVFTYNSLDKEEFSIVEAFMQGQWVYAASCFCFYSATRGCSYPILEKVGGVYFSDLSYWKSTYLQMVFKHLLTEGDKIVISFTCTREEQGIFALISNYGSLIARMVFQPIEESTRVVFSKSSKERPENFLRYLLKFYFYLGLIIVIFAPVNSRFFVSVVLGRRWENNSQLVHFFKWYWVYLPFLSANGVAEALFQAFATSSQDVNAYSKWMMLCSLCFIATALCLCQVFQMSLVGIIVANCINLSMRIMYCSRYLSRKVVVHIDSNYVTAASVGILMYFLQVCILGEVTTFKGFAQSAACGSSFLATILFLERSALNRAAEKKSA